jgi:uncharacterized protein (TIGR03032 family)
MSLSPPVIPAAPPDAAYRSGPGERIECSIDEGFAEWMAGFDGSLAITTYQAGKVVLVGWDGKRVTVLPRHFEKPMGLAVDWPRVALATRNEITLFANAPLLAPDYLETERGKYDALLLPRASYWTGDLHTHDLAFAADGLWLVATRLSCLARPSAEYSLVPVWKPPFVSEVAPEDRCHLNGLCVMDGKPRFVTCLGMSDTPGGWREQKATGGVVVAVDTGEIILQGLAMPHSPRWYAGRLWLLNSGTGEVLALNSEDGQAEIVTILPGYLRGLAFAGRHALVGLCQVREKHIFGGLPVQERNSKLLCGVAAVDLRRGVQVGLLQFTAGATEVYDVQVLPSVRRPALINRDKEAHRQALTAPEFAYWLRASNVVPT